MAYATTPNRSVVGSMNQLEMYISGVHLNSQAPIPTTWLMTGYSSAKRDPAKGEPA